jgi:hypothetical protein
MLINRCLVASLFVGSLACATSAQAQMRDEGAGYSVEVLVDGVPAPTFWHQEQTYVMGRRGERYVVRVVNHTGRRVEAVLSVDGRDVLGGKTADFRRDRGYLVPAWGSVDIDGWRLSQQDVAAFRFTSVRDSYAARMGSARNVGVIGVAVFPERVIYRPRPPYYPYDEATPQYYGRRERSAPANSAAEPESRAPAEPSAPPFASEAPPPARASSAGKSAGPLGRADAPLRAERPGLGTEFGEQMGSPVREVHFVRASAGQPAVVLGVRYDDRQGLMALGIEVDRGGWEGDTYLRQSARPFPAVSRGYSAPPPGWQRW